MTAFMLQWQSWVAATEIVQPEKSEILVIWPLREKCCQTVYTYWLSQKEEIRHSSP